MADENSEVKTFFQKLGRLAANVEDGVKEAQRKISLPKSDLPENSALIASVQLHDSLAALKKEIDATEEELDKTECERENFMDSFHNAMKDAEKKLDELENVLKKYGYVPWQPPQEEESTRNSEDTGDSEDTVPETTKDITTLKTDKEKPSSDELRTPIRSSSALTSAFCNSVNVVRSGAQRYNIDDVTPQLNLKRSRIQPGNHQRTTVYGRSRAQPCSDLRTPVCFSDDVVCTPGLFIQFQKKCFRNGVVMSPSLYRATSYFPSYQYMNEMENVYRNASSPQFYDGNVTVELFKTSSSHNLKKQKESPSPVEPVTHHIIEEIQKYRRERKKKEQSVTPEELTLAQKKESITPEEPVLRMEQLLEDIGKSTKKNAGNRIPIRDENATPESPKLKTLPLFEKSKTFQKYLQEKS